MEVEFKRAGHLGEIHLSDPGSTHTLCKMVTGGIFTPVTPVDIAPRADPTLCVDCKEVYDAREKEEEPEKPTAE